MSTSFFPPQIGYIPTGSAGIVNTSSLILGQDIASPWESIGFGLNGRPDLLETFYINLIRYNAGVPTKVANINISASGVQTLINAAASPTLAGQAALNFQIREVLVCENGSTKKMMILASSTYPTGAS